MNETRPQQVWSRNPLLPFWCLIHKWLLRSSSCSRPCASADSQRQQPGLPLGSGPAGHHRFSPLRRLLLTLELGTVAALFTASAGGFRRPGCTLLLPAPLKGRLCAPRGQRAAETLWMERAQKRARGRRTKQDGTEGRNWHLGFCLLK